MKNVGEVIDKMEEITKLQERLEIVYKNMPVSNQNYADAVEEASDMLNEYIAMLRSVKVNA